MTQLILGAVLVGIVYMLVRPGSPATAGITATTTVLSNLIAAAVTGGSV